ncbi:MAG TPA: hypothetical protein VET48_02030, partial [Steroidobacteraceae bacterium]|nr:hypothetical protein [Steroidobacteraceae bacterium]
MNCVAGGFSESANINRAVSIVVFEFFFPPEPELIVAAFDYSKWRVFGGIMRLREWALLFYASSALSAAHAEITPVEAKRFIEENPKIYDTGAPSEEVLKILKARLPKQGFAAAVDDVAKSWSIGREAADNVATAVVRMELYLGKEELQAASKRKSSHRLLLQAIDLTPQSEKVWGLLREELDERDNCHREKLADRYFARPGAGAEFLRNEDRYCATWLFDYAKRAPMTSLAYWRLAGLFQSEHEEYRIAAFENILSKFRQRDPESSEAVCLTRMYWMSLASIGLGDWVIKDAEKLSESVKHKILVGESPKEIIIEGATIRTELDCSATTNVRDVWLTSLLDTGRRDEARQWIDRLNIVRPTKKPTKDSKERQSVFDTVDDDTNEFLYRSAFPVNDDIFDLFVGDGERGLLWSVGYRTPLVQHLMIKLFDDAGYATVARDLRERLCDTSTPRSLTESLESRLSYLPKEFLAASSKIASAVQQSRIDGTHCVDASAATMLHDNRRVYKELPLSAEQRSPHGKGDFDASIKVPGLESRNIARVDRSGAEWAAISLSNLVDPTGEVGLG